MAQSLRIELHEVEAVADAALGHYRAFSVYAALGVRGRPEDDFSRVTQPNLSWP
jgi:hypothetical protein